MNKREINKKLKNRLSKEKEFHNKRFSKTEMKPNIYRLGLRNWYLDYKNYVLHSKGNLIELGAGLESIFIEYKELDILLEKNILNVISMDISDIAINKCKPFKKKGLSFLVDDAHYLNKIDDQKINVFIGRGIIHHLDIIKFISAVKKKGCLNNPKYVFAEPLESNLLIRFYRFLTPHQRTKDEKPLTHKNIKYIQNGFGGSIKLKYYGFLTIPFSFLGISANFIELADNLILNKFGLGRLLAWSIIITNL